MSTLPKLCASHSIILSFDLVAAHYPKKGWHHREWACTLHFYGRGVTFKFRTGMAHAHPNVADALASLFHDAQSAALSFESYCADFGLDSDSRREYANWESCKEASVKLDHLFAGHLEVRRELEEAASEY